MAVYDERDAVCLFRYRLVRMGAINLGSPSEGEDATKNLDGRFSRFSEDIRMTRNSAPFRLGLVPGGLLHSCSFDGRNSEYGSASLKRSKAGIRLSAWSFSRARRSVPITRRSRPPKKGDTEDASGAWPLMWRLWHEGLRSYRWTWQGNVLHAVAPPNPLVYVICDRGYASHKSREYLWNLGSRPVIPPRKNDPEVGCPRWAYKHRHLVENLWARLKEWRAVTTRYEKTAAFFLYIILIAATADHIKA